MYIIIDGVQNKNMCILNKLSEDFKEELNQVLIRKYYTTKQIFKDKKIIFNIFCKKENCYNLLEFVKSTMYYAFSTTFKVYFSSRNVFMEIGLTNVSCDEYNCYINLASTDNNFLSKYDKMLEFLRYNSIIGREHGNKVYFGAFEGSEEYF